MRKLLIGTSNNISQHIFKIKVWHHSFKKYCDGDVVLIAVDPTQEDLARLHNSNIRYISVSLIDDQTINNQRLDLQIQALRDVKDQYDQVVITDVFDVVFQSDPFNGLDFDKYNLFFGSEGILHSEEPWNMDVLSKCFPEHKKLLQDKQILCSGVIAGTCESLIDLLTDMSELCRHSSGHDIRDQAALNIVHYQYPKSKTKVLTILDNWVLHCATGGPTQFFETWGFKNTLKKRFGIQPHYKHFKIVHQFNRIDEWNNILTHPYVNG